MRASLFSLGYYFSWVLKQSGRVREPEIRYQPEVVMTKGVRSAWTKKQNADLKNGAAMALL